MLLYLFFSCPGLVGCSVVSGVVGCVLYCVFMMDPVGAVVTVCLSVCLSGSFRTREIGWSIPRPLSSLVARWGVRALLLLLCNMKMYDLFGKGVLVVCVVYSTLYVPHALLCLTSWAPNRVVA